MSPAADRSSALMQTQPVTAAPVAVVAPAAVPRAAAHTHERVAAAPPAAAAAIAAAVAKAEAAAAVAKAEAAAAVAAAEAEAAAAAANAAAATAARATTTDPAPVSDAPPAKAGDDEAAGESGIVGKAGLPFSIPYTVAGMPRPSGDTGGGGGFDRRGPREGTVTAYTGWTLRDLKVRRVYCFASTQAETMGEQQKRREGTRLVASCVGNFSADGVFCLTLHYCCGHVRWCG